MHYSQLTDAQRDFARQLVELIRDGALPEYFRVHWAAGKGIIYDINSFHHPGGASIHVFGGNDVTVQYKMIHPYHTDKHLEKMAKVGKVADFVTE